jgi:heme exporter protein CcmD
MDGFVLAAYGLAFLTLTGYALSVWRRHDSADREADRLAAAGAEAQSLAQPSDSSEHDRGTPS